MSYADEIQVPIIAITGDWTVDEIETEDDCDDAFAILTALIVSIEARMDDLAMSGQELSVEHKRAKSALRWKKAALSVVNIKRGKILRRKKAEHDETQSQKLMNYFRAMHPQEMQSALDHVRAGTVDIVTRGTAA